MTPAFIMIKVPGKGIACIPEGLTACGTHGPTKDVYTNFTKYVWKVGERRKNP